MSIYNDWLLKKLSTYRVYLLPFALMAVSAVGKRKQEGIL